MKILLADDEPEILSLMAKKLEEEGFTVLTAQDGEEALTKIRSFIPDLIILDLTMPKKDGLEILEEIRKNPVGNKWQPVIIVSGRGELQDLKKGYQLEADHYITKPCTPQDILRAVRLILPLLPPHKNIKEMKQEKGES